MASIGILEMHFGISGKKVIAYIGIELWHTALLMLATAIDILYKLQEYLLQKPKHF